MNWLKTLGMSNDAIDLLEADHKQLKELFEKFEEAKDRRSKHPVIDKALKLLAVHATVEEELFYPALRKAKLDEMKPLLDEALEEHHVARILMAELKRMAHKENREDRYEAKFEVLAESVRHHIEEEESDMFPKARKAELDWEKLAGRMKERQAQLLEQPARTPARHRAPSGRRARPRSRVKPRTTGRRATTLRRTGAR
jgi:hemerythrin superfamily protein